MEERALLATEQLAQPLRVERSGAGSGGRAREATGGVGEANPERRARARPRLPRSCAERGSGRRPRPSTPLGVCEGGQGGVGGGSAGGQ